MTKKIEKNGSLIFENLFVLNNVVLTTIKDVNFNEFKFIKL
jgi:hypothetical protein